MWTTILAAAPSSPTSVSQSSESVGAILIALITGGTAILVAVIQRKSKTGNDPSNPSHPPVQPFSVPEAEWVTTRDRATTVMAGHLELKERFDGHVKLADEAIDKLEHDIAWLKGRLGL